MPFARFSYGMRVYVFRLKGDEDCFYLKDNFGDALAFLVAKRIYFWRLELLHSGAVTTKQVSQ